MQKPVGRTSYGLLFLTILAEPRADAVFETFRSVGWQSVNRQKFTVDLSIIQADLIDPANPPVRKTMTDDAEKLQQQSNAIWMCSVPAIVWNQIGEWGQLTSRLTFHQQQVAGDGDIAQKIRQWKEPTPRRLTASEISSGLYILEIVMEHAPQLLENMPDDAIPVSIERTSVNAESGFIVTVELIQKAVAWDRRHKVLSIRYHVQLKEVAEGRTSLHAGNTPIVKDKINLLIKRGFKPYH